MAKYTKETDVLFQYSQGYRLIVPNAYKTCHTQFYSVDYPNGLAIAPSFYIVEGGKTYCPVPNQMTVKPNPIIVFAYLLEESRAITESKTVLEVWERPKPPDFVFDPTDTVTYATATELIGQMETAVALEEARQTAETERASAESARASAEASRVSAESARVSAETSRATAESDRVTAESERAEAETLRETAESKRATAESSRASAEASRVSVEESRVSAESSRASAESTRVSAETSRSDAESSRVSNESARVAAEASRKSAEASRAEAESSRNTAEESRVTAESSRASAELSRANAETNRVNAETARQTAESNRTLSEDSRVTAETGRASAENERQESETARQTAETSRANAESSRANAEATRVSKESARASAEETRQANEEARASAESSRASAEEARASAESARASAEAKRETKWSNASATAAKGEADADVVITDSGVTFNFKIPQGEKGDPGVRGLTGETGNGISSMTLVSGTHAAGTVDTYRLTFTDGTYQDFTVYNGANGDGAGDMLWSEFNNRFNPSGKNGQLAFESDLTAHTEVFLVTFTLDEATGNYTADKTFAEIMAAYEAGKIVLGKVGVPIICIGQLSIVAGGNGVCFSFNELFGSGKLLAIILGTNDQTMFIRFPYYSSEFSQYTILTSGWSSGVYSFESDFPNATYDIEIELDSTATESQVEAWSSAKVTAVFGTNTMKALGDVPTVDIPVIVKAVVK